MYEPNVAEYYFSTFKDGKDMDDMMRWAEKWEKWADETDLLANADYRASMLIPYYHGGEDQHDFVWLGISTNPEEMHKVMTVGSMKGTKLLAELNKILDQGNQTIYTWQRTVSETPRWNCRLCCLFRL